MNLNIHCIMHVPFEGLGYINTWINNNGHNLSFTKMYKGDGFPDFESFDWLIVMGGPMGIYDDNDYPWLPTERQFIKDAIAKNKTVIGICLGAQFIADAIGGKVFKNEHEEIGWFPITTEANSPIINSLPEKFNVFHWHGDTFSIPKEATLLFSSKACENQGFIFNNKVLGLQFHIEITDESLADMIKNVGQNLTESEYVQNKESIMMNGVLSEQANKKLEIILNQLLIK